MAEHTPTPWTYRPNKHDDWGWIRGQPGDGETVGPIVATARGGSHNANDWDEHRRNKTDPFEPNAAFIIKAVNNHEALVDALRALDVLLDFGDDALDNVWTFEDLTSIQAAFNKAKAALDQVTGDAVGGARE